MTDLETAIRDALRERGRSVPIRNTTLVARRRRWVAPLLAAALVIALVAITLVVVARKSTTTPPAAPTTSPSFVGYSWRLVQIDDRQGRLTLPVSTTARVSFAHGGTMTGNDTVHALQVRYRIVPTGYQPAGPVTASGNGLAGPVSATLKRTLSAIGSCFSSSLSGGGKPPQGAPIAAAVHGERLTLHTGAGVLTFVRGRHA